MRELRIIIAGSRDFNDYEKMEYELKRTLSNRVFDADKIVIISGTARGADKLGEQFAYKYKLDVKRFPADWNKYGKSAGYIRNENMAKYAVENNNIGVLVAFWNGSSKGTNHMIKLAEKHNLETHIVRI